MGHSAAAEARVESAAGRVPRHREVSRGAAEVAITAEQDLAVALESQGRGFGRNAPDDGGDITRRRMNVGSSPQVSSLRSSRASNRGVRVRLRRDRFGRKSLPRSKFGRIITAAPLTRPRGAGGRLPIAGPSTFGGSDRGPRAPSLRIRPETPPEFTHLFDFFGIFPTDGHPGLSQPIQGADPPVSLPGLPLLMALPCELQARVVVGCAEETEGEVVVILPGDLARQGAVLAVLVDEVQDAVGVVGLAGDGGGGLAAGRGGPGEVAVVLDRESNLGIRGGRGRPVSGQLTGGGGRRGGGRCGCSRRRLARSGLVLRDEAAPRACRPVGAARRV